MKKIALLVFLFSVNIQYSHSQIKIDTFSISVDSTGGIAGTHFYKENVKGPLVIFSGGCNVDQQKYFDVASKIAALGYHVVTYDLRGHGKSSARLTSEKPNHDKPPIRDQATHDGQELHHGEDLNTIYQYSIDLPDIEQGQTVLSLSGCIMSWSFDMISAHPELRKFILLTSFFGEKGESFFSKNSGFNVLTVLTKDNPQFAQLTKDYFSQNNTHTVEEIRCESGWAETVFEKCSNVGQQIADWIIKVS